MSSSNFAHGSGKTPGVPLPQPASIDDKLKAFDNAPLFMKSLPTDSEDDVVVQALQSLAYEGTPDEVAQNFKDQGNEYFKGGRFREALGFYSQAIDAKPTDTTLQESIFCNRAACNLQLKNYGSVLKDCSKAIVLNTKASKAYYRSAMALIALERYEDALDCCERCLMFDTDNDGVIQAKTRAQDAKAKKDEKEAKMQQRLKEESDKRNRMKTAFEKRHLIATSDKHGSDSPCEPHFDPEDPSQETLIFPAFFLYPQYATSDVISEFVEDTHFSAHLEQMFPPTGQRPDWDAKAEYDVSSIVVYAMTHRRRLLKVGKKMTLRDVITVAHEKPGAARDGLELKNGYLTFVVLKKGDVEEKWVTEYKQASL